MPRKILFILTHSEYGGAQRFLRTLVSNLKSGGYEMTVAFGTGDKKNIHSLDFLDKELKKLGIKTLVINNLVRSPNLILDIRAAAEIRKLIKNTKPDILFLGSSKAGFIGSLASVFPKKINNLRVIYRIGGWSFNDPEPSWKRRLWILLERISSSWKDIIIVNSKKDYNDAKRLKIIPRDGCVLIHNGIGVYDEIFLEKEDARLMLFKFIKNNSSLFNCKTIVGTIANFYKTKGIEYLVRAAKQLKDEDMCFIIIGNGPLNAEIEALIDAEGIKSKIFLTGQIPNASRYLRAFDIYVQPSLKEGFPWSVLEAMTAKLPIVATSVGAIPEMIDDGKSGFLVDPYNSGQLANAILKLSDDDHLRQEFGIQANQKVHFNFDVDSMIEKIKALL